MWKITFALIYIATRLIELFRSIADHSIQEFTYFKEDIIAMLRLGED